MTTRFRLLSFFFALLFAYAAAIQLNDPDPLRWIVLYAGAATIAAWAALHPVPRVLPALWAVGAAVWAALLVPGIVREAMWTANEEERELAGLLLVAGWMARLAVQRIQRQRSEAL